MRAAAEQESEKILDWAVGTGHQCKYEMTTCLSDESTGNTFGVGQNFLRSQPHL